MQSQRLRTTWLAVHLALGLIWVAVLSALANQDPSLALQPRQVAQMLLWAAWLPTSAVACWQVSRRRWKALLLSDLLSFGVVVVVACTAYVPLFLFNVVWFLPFGLLPRGLLTEALMRLSTSR